MISMFVSPAQTFPLKSTLICLIQLYINVPTKIVIPLSPLKPSQVSSNSVKGNILPVAQATKFVVILEPLSFSHSSYLTDRNSYWLYFQNKSTVHPLNHQSLWQYLYPGHCHLLSRISQEPPIWNPSSNHFPPSVYSQCSDPEISSQIKSFLFSKQPSWVEPRAQRLFIIFLPGTLLLYSQLPLWTHFLLLCSFTLLPGMDVLI